MRARKTPLSSLDIQGNFEKSRISTSKGIHIIGAPCDGDINVSDALRSSSSFSGWTVKILIRAMSRNFSPKKKLFLTFFYVLIKLDERRKMPSGGSQLRKLLKKITSEIFDLLEKERVSTSIRDSIIK